MIDLSHSGIWLYTSLLVAKVLTILSFWLDETAGMQEPRNTIGTGIER